MDAFNQIPRKQHRMMKRREKPGTKAQKVIEYIKMSRCQEGSRKNVITLVKLKCLEVASAPHPKG